KTIGDGTRWEITSVFFPIEALFCAGGDQFPVNKKRRCRVMPLRDAVFAVIETGPMTLLKRDRTFKATDAYDLHGRSPTTTPSRPRDGREKRRRPPVSSELPRVLRA